MPDMRDTMYSERGYDRAVYNIKNGYSRRLDYDPEEWRSIMINDFGKNSEIRREALFDEHHPYAHHSRLVHTNPYEARDIAYAAFRIRRVGWRSAQWQATMRALNLDLKLHRRYLLGLIYVVWAEDDRAWELDVPHRVPTGIPLGRPNANDRQNWGPDVTAYDIEEAALRELEISMDGAATAVLHPLLPGSTEKTKVAQRVADYLAHYRDVEDTDDLPDNPYDPLHWGHDSRVKSIRLLTSDGDEIGYTPDFDPEVTNYQVDTPLANCTWELEFFDPVLQTSDATDTRGGNQRSLHLTVVAKAGTSRKDYSFYESPPPTS